MSNTRTRRPLVGRRFGGRALVRRGMAAAGITALALLPAACSSGSSPSPSPSASEARYAITVKPTGTAMSAADAKAMDESARKSLRESKDGTPGMVIGIWDPKKGYHVAAYGRAEMKGPAATTADNAFIGSITKTATAAAVLEQVAAGKLSLGDTVAQADPDLAAKFPQIADITVQRLLDMSSGIPDYANQESTGVLPIIFKDPQTEFTPDDLIEEGLKAAPVMPVGTPGYSTTNYIILGELLAKATGKSPEEAVSAVFGELGIDGMKLPNPTELPPAPYSHGYLGSVESKDAKSKGETYPADTDVTDWNRSWARAGGGAYADVTQLKDFAATAFGTTLLPESLGTQRLTPRTVMLESIEYGPYGLGIFRKGDWVGHTGQMLGWEALAHFNLKTGAVAVALVNSSSGLAAADGVIDSFFPEINAIWLPTDAEVAAIPNKPSGAATPPADDSSAPSGSGSPQRSTTAGESGEPAASASPSGSGSATGSASPTGSAPPSESASPGN